MLGLSENVVLPEDYLDSMEVLEVFICPEMTDTRMLIMIHKIKEEPIQHVVRVYKLLWKNQQFNIDFELDAFPFKKRQDALAFADRLSGLTAYQLLMAQNEFDITTEDGRALK
ncbi:hypothetical protein ACXYMX_16380 [Sporosarcina sp. CAU 1771]